MQSHKDARHSPGTVAAAGCPSSNQTLRWEFTCADFTGECCWTPHKREREQSRWGSRRSWAAVQSQQKPQLTLQAPQSCPEVGQGPLCPPGWPATERMLLLRQGRWAGSWARQLSLADSSGQSTEGPPVSFQLLRFPRLGKRTLSLKGRGVWLTAGSTRVTIFRISNSIWFYTRHCLLISYKKSRKRSSQEIRKINTMEAGKELQILLWFLCRKCKIPLFFCHFLQLFLLFFCLCPFAVSHSLCDTHTLIWWLEPKLEILTRRKQKRRENNLVLVTDNYYPSRYCRFK